MTQTKIMLAFKRAEENVIEWPCAIQVPLNGGGFEEQQLTARFKVLPDERHDFLYPSELSVLAEVRSALEAPPPMPPASDSETPAEKPKRRGDEGLLDEALLGLVGVPGAGALTEVDVAASLRKVPYIRDGLVRGYQEMIGRRVTKN